MPSKDTVRPPRAVDNNTADCKCDHCGVKLDGRKTVWWFREFLGCSKACVLARASNDDAIAMVAVGAKLIETLKSL